LIDNQCTMEFTFIELFNYFGATLGVLLSVIVIFRNRGKRKIKISLFIVLIISSAIVFLGTLGFSGKIRYFPHLLRIDSPVHFLLGPVLYFYVLSSLKVDLKFRWLHLLHLVPFILNTIYFSPLFFSDAHYKLNYYDHYYSTGSIVIKQLYLLKTLSVFAYWFAELIILLRYYREQRGEPTYNKSLAICLSLFLAIQFISFSALLFDHVTALRSFSDPYMFAISIVSVLLSTTAVALLFFPQLLYGITYQNSEEHKKYIHSSLSNEQKNELLSDLQRYMENGSEPFLNLKLFIRDVAIRLDTNSQRLSQVVNEKLGMNFNDYINSLRIGKAIDLLHTLDLEKYTIDVIAEKSGFNSKSAFYAAFKKHTGSTPKAYIKRLQKV
jgi:AraC-like DNA-binding protein